MSSQRRGARRATALTETGRGVGRASRRARRPPRTAARHVTPVRACGASFRCASTSTSSNRSSARLRAAFMLRRTVVVLRGDGHEGRGEEADYNHPPGAPALPGCWTVRSFRSSGHAHARLFLRPAVLAANESTAAGALESAGTRLALSPGGPVRLPQAVRRESKPLTYVAAARGANRSTPGWRFTPISGSSSTPTPNRLDELIERLAATGRVDTLDFKGIYRGDFGFPPDASLYRTESPGGVPGRMARGSGAHSRRCPQRFRVAP